MKAIFIILILSFLTAGCTRPSVQPVVTTVPTEVTTSISVHDKPVAATAQRTDSTKILIMYRGGPDTNQLTELETTVITSKGSVHIQSMGSRLDTTPVQIGATDVFWGLTQKKCMS